MKLRPIRTRREHQAALKEAEVLWNAPEGSPAADRLEVLKDVATGSVLDLALTS